MQKRTFLKGGLATLGALSGLGLIPDALAKDPVKATKDIQ